MSNDKVSIRVYLKSGQVFEYDVADHNKAREHSYQIWATGYRSATGDWYGKHWIDKIKLTPPPPTNYPDRVMGT